MAFSKKTLIIYIFSIIAILLWGMSYIWSDSLLRAGIPVEYFVFIRILTAGIILLILNLVFGKNIRIKKKDIGRFILLSMFEPFIYFVCETYGIHLTKSPTYSSLIIATTPIFSVVAGVLFFNEKVNFLNILGIIICLAGLFMVTVCASSVGKYFLWGVLLLILAVLAEVSHASFTKVLASSYEPQVIVMYQFLFGSIFLLPLFLSIGIKSFDANIYLSWNVIRSILFLSVFCSSIAFSLWAASIKHLGVAKSSIFMAMIPIVTAFAGFLLGKELLSPIQWGGITVACLGLIFSQSSCKLPLCKR